MSKYTNDRKKYIDELKKIASEVKQIIGQYRKRRPIVIEFSGVPKSGKTSSINSLMQFLKRNDFKVKILQESASVCPVKDKHSPKFNLWTVCDSIKSLVGELESERTRYDVIIMDRGIFDAMCWFQWLVDNRKMEHEMQDIMKCFLGMDELTSCIDIVFVYKATPEVSIEREYASLLTDVPGSIMNQEVLGEYLNAIDVTVGYAEKEKIFRRVEIIDTSNINQNDVGKKVTETTLNILKEMFEENIGYIKMLPKIEQKFGEAYWMRFEEFEKLDGTKIRIHFKQRSTLEEDKAFVQIVPIAVFKEKGTGEVLIVKKPDKAVGATSNEKGKILPYVGGHLRREDMTGKNENDFVSMCKTALKREVREELGIAISLDDVKPDFIYVKDGSRSDIHMAVCFLITEKKDTMKVRMESDELLTNRGKGKSGTFVPPETITDSVNPWGEIILERYFDMVEQISIFNKKG